MTNIEIDWERGKADMFSLLLLAATIPQSTPGPQPAVVRSADQIEAARKPAPLLVSAGSKTMASVMSANATDTADSARPHPGFTYRQAASMSPADLADALLPATHPEIETAVISDGMGEGPGGPPRPGPGYLGEIKLMTAASRVGDTNFCTRSEFAIRFKLVNPQLSGWVMTPYRTERSETYFYNGDAVEKRVCSKPMHTFPSSGPDHAAQLAMLDAYAVALRRVVAGEMPLPFRYRCRRSGDRYSDVCRRGALTALRSLSIDQVTEARWDPATQRWSVEAGSINSYVTLDRKSGQVTRIEIRETPILLG